jgi:hypothetical protein
MLHANTHVTVTIIITTTMTMTITVNVTIIGTITTTIPIRTMLHIGAQRTEKEAAHRLREPFAWQCLGRL